MIQEEMHTVIYEMNITALGPEVLEFAQKDGLLVTFEEGAPPELAEVSALHVHGPLISPVQVGDVVWIDGMQFLVTAVGSVANKNLEALGHAIFKFDGATEPLMPGTIHLLGDGKPPTIQVGSKIWIVRERSEKMEDNFAQVCSD